MKKYDGYDNAEAFTGDYEQLEPGGYVCQILKVVSEEKDYGHLLRIGFDIVEGEHKEFYKRQHARKKETNPQAKWPGMYYQTVKEDDLRYFKGFIVAIESSNPGFKWAWDEQKLVGKLFGGVFGQEEYIIQQGKRAGEIGLSTKCRFIRTIEQVRNGVDIPEVKQLNGGHANTPVEVDESDLPF
jgi:hypothetical protein